MKTALDALRQAGCRRVYIDGSFITSKMAPNDFDACWEIGGVDPIFLDPVLLTFDHGRRAQKAAYGGELFPANAIADRSGTQYLQFLQRYRNTGDPKGIITIDLRGLP